MVSIAQAPKRSVKLVVLFALSIAVIYINLVGLIKNHDDSLLSKIFTIHVYKQRTNNKSVLQDDAKIHSKSEKVQNETEGFDNNESVKSAVLKKQLQDVFWVIKTQAGQPAKNERLNKRLEEFLKTWYRAIPPENVLLILGNDRTEDKLISEKLEKLLHKSTLIATMCGNKHDKQDLHCRTAAFLEIVSNLIVNADNRKFYKNDSSLYREIVTNLEENAVRDWDENKFKSITGDAKFRANLKYAPFEKLKHESEADRKEFKKRTPNWFCYLDDDVYVHPDRLAEFLHVNTVGKKLLDPAKPYALGAFCSESWNPSGPWSQIKEQNVNNNNTLGSHIYQVPPDRKITHPCGQVCFSRGVFDDFKLIETRDREQAKVSKDVQSPKVEFNAKKGLPYTTGTVLHSYNLDTLGPDDVLLGSMTAAATKVLVNCFFSQYWSAKKNCQEIFKDNGDSSGKTNFLQEYSFALHVDGSQRAKSKVGKKCNAHMQEIGGTLNYHYDSYPATTSIVHGEDSIELKNSTPNEDFYYAYPENWNWVNAYDNRKFNGPFDECKIRSTEDICVTNPTQYDRGDECNYFNCRQPEYGTLVKAGKVPDCRALENKLGITNKKTVNWQTPVDR